MNEKLRAEVVSNCLNWTSGARLQRSKKSFNTLGDLGMMKMRIPTRLSESHMGILILCTASV
jgi:hypothetical protein